MDDSISRQAAIDVVHSNYDEILDFKSTGRTVADSIEDILSDLPSAEPERKEGKWIYNSPVTMKCDQCGLVIKDWDWHRFKYCPNCDSVMNQKVGNSR